MLDTISLVSTPIVLIGFFAAWIYGRKTTTFRWTEYFAMLAAPFLVFLLHVYIGGHKFLYFFIASALIGWMAELILAFSYHKILNKRLWIYKQFPVFNGYVSWLTLPIWGFAGMLFLKIASLVGIIQDKSHLLGQEIFPPYDFPGAIPIKTPFTMPRNKSRNFIHSRRFKNSHLQAGFK